VNHMNCARAHTHTHTRHASIVVRLHRTHLAILADQHTAAAQVSTVEGGDGSNSLQIGEGSKSYRTCICLVSI
jgi:hypothetical protein